MLQCYLCGVANCGLPSRERCDKEGENKAVSEFMLRERGDVNAVNGLYSDSVSVQKL